MRGGGARGAAPRRRRRERVNCEKWRRKAARRCRLLLGLSTERPTQPTAARTSHCAASACPLGQMDLRQETRLIEHCVSCRRAVQKLFTRRRWPWAGARSQRARAFGRRRQARHYSPSSNLLVAPALLLRWLRAATASVSHWQIHSARQSTKSSVGWRSRMVSGITRVWYSSGGAPRSSLSTSTAASPSVCDSTAHASHPWVQSTATPPSYSVVAHRRHPKLSRWHPRIALVRTGATRFERLPYGRARFCRSMWPHLQSTVCRRRARAAITCILHSDGAAAGGRWWVWWAYALTMTTHGCGRACCGRGRREDGQRLWSWPLPRADALGRGRVGVYGSDEESRAL